MDHGERQAVMKKKIVFAALVAPVALAASAFAQSPTFDKLADISVQSIDSLASDVLVLDGDAYVTGFNNRTLIRIENVLSENPGTPTAIVADMSVDSAETFATGRGPTTINPTQDGNLIVAADTGSAGTILVYDTNGTLVREMSADRRDGRRVAGAIEVGSPNAGERRILATQVGGTLWTFNSAIDAFAGTAGINHGVSFGRDIVVVPTGAETSDIYISRTGSADENTHDSIRRATGGDVLNLGQTAAYDGSWTEFYSFGVRSFNASRGMDLFVYNGENYIATTTGSAGEIRFINTTTGVVDFAIDTDLEQTFGVRVVENNGDVYVLVSHYVVIEPGPEPPAQGDARITIFGVDGAELIPEATSVSDWMLSQ